MELTFQCLSCNGRPPNPAFGVQLARCISPPSIDGRISSSTMTEFANNIQRKRLLLEQSLFSEYVSSHSATQKSLVDQPDNAAKLNEPGVATPWWGKTSSCGRCDAVQASTLSEAIDEVFPVSSETESRVGFRSMHIGSIPIRALLTKQKLSDTAQYAGRDAALSVGRDFSLRTDSYIKKCFQCHSAACVLPGQFMTSSQLDYLFQRQIIQLPSLFSNDIQKWHPNSSGGGTHTDVMELMSRCKAQSLSSIIEVDRDFETWNKVWPKAKPILKPLEFQVGGLPHIERLKQMTSGRRRGILITYKREYSRYGYRNYAGNYAGNQVTKIMTDTSRVYMKDTVKHGKKTQFASFDTNLDAGVHSNFYSEIRKLASREASGSFFFDADVLAKYLTVRIGDIVTLSAPTSSSQGSGITDDYDPNSLFRVTAVHYGAYSRNGTATEFSLESLLAVPQKRCASRVRTS